MSTLSALLAMLVVAGQPSSPVATLRTYVSPVDYLAPEYAAPLPGAPRMASGKSVKLAVTICWLRDDRADRKGKMMLRPWPLLLLCCVCGGCSGAQLRVNDERAEGAVREIKAAETIFKTKTNRFATLRELVDAGLVGRALVDNMEFQHRFNIVAARDTYEAVAVPVDRDDQYAYVGWSFYVDESGIIRGSAYEKANGYVVAGKHDSPVRSQ